MTTLRRALAATGRASLWLGLVGIGSGMFNSPNTAAMMGTVPPHRRGIAGGARTMLQNTGAVISIAFVLAIITAAVPKDVLFSIFSGIASGLSDARLAPVHREHAHGAVGARGDVGRRRRRLPAAPRPRQRGGGMSEKPLRIGEVAERAETTVRTVRYYEEVGLLPGSEERSHGQHRSYSEADVERLREILQLKELLNLSLEELRGLVEAEEARAAIRAQYRSATEAAERERLLDGRRRPPRPPARADPRPPDRPRRARGAPGRAPRARRRAPGRAAPLARAALSTRTCARCRSTRSRSTAAS